MADISRGCYVFLALRGGLCVGVRWTLSALKVVRRGTKGGRTVESAHKKWKCRQWVILSIANQRHFV